MGRRRHCSRAGIMFHLEAMFQPEGSAQPWDNQRPKLRNASVSAHFMRSAKWITQEGVLDVAGSYALDQVLR